MYHWLHWKLFWSFWLFLTLLTKTATGSDGLKNVRFDAPRYIRKGEDLTLTCQYDIDTRSLYAVKWYRGSEEFARYLPKEIPPQQFFPQKGINVNITQLTEHQVLLKNITQNTSGIYKCVVSAETTFKTLADEQEVTVVAIGYESPKLFVDQLDYTYGDTAKANCSIEGTPPVNITWFIDNEQVSKEKASIYLKPEPSNPEVTTSISMLSITIQDTSSYIRVKCTGQLYDIYNMSSEMTIPLRPRRLSMMSTSSDTLTKRYNGTLRGCAADIFIKLHGILFLTVFGFILSFLQGISLSEK